FERDAAGTQRLTADGRRAVPGILIKDPFGSLARRSRRPVQWLSLPASKLTGLEAKVQKNLEDSRAPDFDGAGRAARPGNLAVVAETGRSAVPPAWAPAAPKNLSSRIGEVPAPQGYPQIRFEKPYAEFRDGKVKAGLLGMEAAGGAISGRNGGGPAWIVAAPLFSAYGLSLKAAYGALAMTGYNVNTETNLTIRPDPRAPAMQLVVKSVTPTPPVVFHPMAEVTLEPLKLAEAAGLSSLRFIRRYIEPFVGADLGYITIGQTVRTRSNLYLRQNGSDRFMQGLPDEISPTGQPRSQFGGAFVGGVNFKFTENQGAQIRYINAPTGFQGVLGGYWFNW
ncbi:MAG: hypothetical protein PHF00_07650, partial [Elusimicrobia bacterium]|nr:hypothetical protein [Elusimicrobiota bacterium]